MVARIAAIQSAFAPPAPTPSTQPSTTAPAAGGSSFAGMLTSAMGPGAAGAASPTTPIGGAGGSGPGDAVGFVRTG